MIEVLSIVDGSGRILPQRMLTAEEAATVIYARSVPGKYIYYQRGVDEDLVSAIEEATQKLMDDVNSSLSSNWNIKLNAAKSMQAQFGDEYLENYMETLHEGSNPFDQINE
jgi:hypothetical protein